jgi:hypothetical protein
MSEQVLSRVSSGVLFVLVLDHLTRAFFTHLS